MPTACESDSVSFGRRKLAAGSTGAGLGMAAKDIGVKKYVIKLSEAERSHLEGVINKGKSPAKRLLKARILLKADAGAHGEGWSDGRIMEALDASKSMVTRVRQQFVEEGLEAALSRKQRAAPAITPIFDGEKEARLMALACSRPPEGHARWTARSGHSARLPGRDLEATGVRDAHANSDETRTAGAV